MLSTMDFSRSEQNLPSSSLPAARRTTTFANQCQAGSCTDCNTVSVDVQLLKGIHASRQRHSRAGRAPSSLARKARPRVQAKMEATGLVDVSRPFWCSRQCRVTVPAGQRPSASRAQARTPSHMTRVTASCRWFEVATPQPQGGRQCGFMLSCAIMLRVRGSAHRGLPPTP
jgi:hypothetical protein